MLRAIIFDFDGVIADTEPLHYESFAAVLAGRSIALSRDEYFTQYVGLNDPTLLRTIFTDRGRPADEELLHTLRSAKDADYQARIVEGLSLLPGVEKFVRQAARRYLPAICSGARRAEIETVLGRHDMLPLFQVIVSVDDVAVSKPDPTGFLRTLELLREKARDLSTEDCLVIEDSLPGIRAAKAAAMKVLAVTGAAHYSDEQTRRLCESEADAVRESLVGVNIEEL